MTEVDTRRLESVKSLVSPKTWPAKGLLPVEAGGSAARATAERHAAIRSIAGTGNRNSKVVFVMVKA
jgi:hypothetical protein